MHAVVQAGLNRVIAGGTLHVGGDCMPIFEYRCGHCKEVFEFLQRGKDTPACPACGSKDLKKLLSRFNSCVQGGTGGGSGGGACGTCSGGSCSTCGK